MKTVAILMALFVAANVILAYQAPELTAYVSQIPGRDKTGHLVVMGVFALLVASSIPDRRLRLGSFAIPAAIPLVLVAVTLEEVSQIWLKHRTFSYADLLSSYGGILAFGALGVVLARPSRSSEVDSAQNRKSL